MNGCNLANVMTATIPSRNHLFCTSPTIEFMACCSCIFLATRVNFFIPGVRACAMESSRKVTAHAKVVNKGRSLIDLVEGGKFLPREAVHAISSPNSFSLQEMSGYSPIVCLLVSLCTSLYCVSGSQISAPQFMSTPSFGASNISYNRLVKTISSAGQLGLPSQSSHDQTSFTCSGLTKRSMYYIKRLEVIKQSHWVSRLRYILAEMKNNSILRDKHHVCKQVTVVFGDANYALSLLNWLVSALVQTNPPLENVIVISIDKELQALLDSKEIRSVYVNPETITCGVVRRKISRIWIARCAVYRLLNHWGYDVMAYDSDGIVLRNLKDVLDAYPESDIVGSAGYYPFELGAKWGQTLCLGVVLFRSTRNTGERVDKFQYKCTSIIVIILYWTKLL